MANENKNRITIEQSTFERLRDFKAGMGNTYDELLNALLDLVGAERGREFERGRELRNQEDERKPTSV